VLLSNRVHDARHFEELWLRELAQNSLQLGPLNQTGQLEVVLGAVLKIAVLIPCVLHEVSCPNGLLTLTVATVLVLELDAHCHIQCRRR